MINIEIYDSGIDIVDRYTVVIDDSVYLMSDDPLSPAGMNQFCCEKSEAVALDDIQYQKIKMQDAPKDILIAIIQRLTA